MVIENDDDTSAAFSFVSLEFSVVDDVSPVAFISSRKEVEELFLPVRKVAVFVPVFRSGVEIQIGCKGVACSGLFGRLIRAVRVCSNMQEVLDGDAVKTGKFVKSLSGRHAASGLIVTVCLPDDSEEGSYIVLGISMNLSKFPQAFTKALFFFRRGQKSHRSFCKAQDIENS